MRLSLLVDMLVVGFDQGPGPKTDAQTEWAPGSNNEQHDEHLPDSI